MPSTVTATTAAIIRSIAITTPTNPSIATRADGSRKRRPNGDGLSRAVATLLPATLGILLLYLAVPRTFAAWAGLDAQPALEKLQEGKPPSDVELATGISGLQRALGWVASARRLTDLAMLELAQAERLPIADSARLRLLASAERHLLDGLAVNPVNGFAWLRLALIRELRGAPPREIAAALAQSLDMAPNTRKLWLPRMALFIVYWRDLSFDELLAVRAHLRTIWEVDAAIRRPLTQAALQAGELPILVWALGDNPASPEDIERLKASAPPKAR
jgi:hypothetical protein